MQQLRNTQAAGVAAAGVAAAAEAAGVLPDPWALADLMRRPNARLLLTANLPGKGTAPPGG